MTRDRALTNSPLPKTWPTCIKSAILHVISLAHLAITHARGRATNTFTKRLGLAVQLERAENHISLLEEEMRIKDARMGLLDPRRRPYYQPTDRLAILEVKAARGWSVAQTARRFLVQPATIASWLKRVDETGKSALVQTREPVNRFPDFVRHIIRRLKVLCPTLGKMRIAQTLTRAGVHLGVSTVGRILKEEAKEPKPEEGALAEEDDKGKKHKPVTARYADHTWQVDLTVVPIGAGFWVPWLPFALPQFWPFCWWVACVIDHYSRRVVGFTVFSKEPKSVDIRRFLGRVIGTVGNAPKYIISDKGRQFDCPGFRAWCRPKNIQPRYASTENHGATAIIERFFRSLKDEWLRRILVPLSRGAMQRKISLYLTWYHGFRPHQSLAGRTPSEVYDGLRPANTKARFEPRPNWPKDSPCARPHARPRKRQPPRLSLVVRFLEGNRNLPIVEVKKAA